MAGIKPDITNEMRAAVWGFLAVITSEKEIAKNVLTGRAQYKTKFCNFVSKLYFMFSSE